ncbi:hypothetical protein CHUAL_002348 [Chamberlinius hualienensis]
MPYSSLKGKVAIVTGGASGIGEATAKRLASYGVILALADVNGDGLAKVAKECTEISKTFTDISKPLIFVGDLSCGTTRAKLVEETVTTFGKLDILLISRAVYDLCRLASHHLVKTKGSIVNISSIAGHYGNTGNPAYTIAKAGVIQLTKIVAQELGEHGVRVNSISPGAIKTNIFKIPPGETKFFDEVAKTNATMKRAGEADEIAKVIAFMISDENLYMNGSDVLVDGGFLVKKRDIPKIE